MLARLASATLPHLPHLQIRWVIATHSRYSSPSNRRHQCISPPLIMSSFPHTYKVSRAHQTTQQRAASRTITQPSRTFVLYNLYRKFTELHPNSTSRAQPQIPRARCRGILILSNTPSNHDPGAPPRLSPQKARYLSPRSNYNRRRHQS